MKYKKPEVTALTPAINAIQGHVGAKFAEPTRDNPLPEGIGAYEDWE
jgi:hypothetical protein